ncbi:hypothetical protein AMATHDRAFT_73546 [Amanita thiersii Skay4041]|uniref:F-box domain-containing protein n=1 Tax=Amanita thiersii Skay4041 TaxID=703135 RepID=A0A2A9NY01_9AGAR|nr:hypothetical protein AMATHDRAFT_73546 [Amanita thiersii Skay4041]
MSLPPELCGLICQQPVLRRNDLRALCTVSRPFRAEAERLLYSRVTLRCLRHIRSWCVALALRGPYLASRVHHLSLTMPPAIELVPADYSRLIYALSSCLNLAELEVLSDGRSSDGDSSLIWILEGHPWHLSKFTNTYFPLSSLRSFFDSQSNMQTLVLRTSTRESTLESALPKLLPRNLTTLDTSAAVLRSVATSSAMHIRRLQYHMAHARGEEELPTFVALTRLSQTLTSLSIVRHGRDEGMDVAVVAACIAAQLPHLRYFRLIDNTIRSSDSLVPLLPFSVNFQSVESLIIKPATRLHEDDDILRCIYHELDTEQGRYSAGVRIMYNMSTLKFLALILDQDYGFRRSKDDAVISLGVVNIDPNAWMEA